MGEKDLLLRNLFELASTVHEADLSYIVQKLSDTIPLCRFLSGCWWKNVDEGSALVLFSSFFKASKCIHERCLECISAKQSSENSFIDQILSSAYEVQCIFTAAMSRCEALRRDLYNPQCANTFCLMLFQLANVADKLDPRISLPLWKLIPTFLQQYKNELNKSFQYTVDNSIVIHETNGSSGLDTMLSCLLDSTQHFMTKCLNSEKAWDGATATTNINLKMLNLLSRIATFCIREFSTNALTNQNCGKGLKDWLRWMIKMRHRGGVYTSGSGINPSLVQALESSAFLAVEVVLNHLLSHPVPQLKECTVVAVLLKYDGSDPELHCRMYGTLMAGLTRQPQYFGRWFNEDFNLFQEFFSACADIHLSDEPEDDSPCNPDKRLRAIAGEFYTTLLSQICACVCGLPASCFTYLESALLTGLLSEHLWTSMLATDVWCFLARYGTSDLCWQYTMILSEALRRSAFRIIQSSGSMQQNSSILPSLDRLGWLLARLIVFLTSKQQVEFLRLYRLSCVDSILDEATRAVLWWFVPLRVERLQKAAQSMVRDQLVERMSNLSRNVAGSTESDFRSNLFHTVNAAVTLYLVDSMPMSFRKDNATTLAQLTVYTLSQSAILIDHNPVLPCASWLSHAIRCPISALTAHLSVWNPHLSQSSIHSSPNNPLFQLVQWLVDASDSKDASPVLRSPFCSFSVLRAWYLWVLCSMSNFFSQRQSDHSDPVWLRQLCSCLRIIPLESIDVTVRPVLAALNEKLRDVRPHVVDCNSVQSKVSNQVQELENAFTLLEQEWQRTRSLRAEDMTALKQISSRLNTMLNRTQGTDWN